MLERLMNKWIGQDWKTTTQPILSVVMTASAVLAAVPPPHISPWAAWIVSFSAAFSKIYVGSKQQG